jgi:hypothetical protein
MEPKLRDGKTSYQARSTGYLLLNYTVYLVRSVSVLTWRGRDTLNIRVLYRRTLPWNSFEFSVVQRPFGSVVE